MASISVIIPLYNKVAYIRRALSSVMNQTVLPDEIIVIDDGSDDGSAAVVASLGWDRVRLIHQANKGAAAARNHGASLAANDLLAFLDADDVWQPTFLETVCRLQTAYPQAGIWATSYLYCRPDGGHERPKYAGSLPSGNVWEGLLQDFFAMSSGDCPLCSSAVMLSRQALFSVGKFPEGELIGEDIDAWMRLAMVFPVAWSARKEALYYQLNETSIMKRACLGQELKVIQTLKVAYASRQNDHALGNLIAKFYLDSARKFFLEGERADTIQAVERGLAYSSGSMRRTVFLKWVFYHLPTEVIAQIARFKAVWNRYYYRPKRKL